MNNIVKGTTFKLNLHMEPMDGHHLSDISFFVDVYVGAGKLTITKEQARRVDQDNYIIVVDSTELTDVGACMLTLTAYIPDTDCSGGVRKEIAKIPTGVRIVA